MVAMPSSGLELLGSPRMVKPAVSVTITVRVESNIRVLILSLYGSTFGPNFNRIIPNLWDGTLVENGRGSLWGEPADFNADHVNHCKYIHEFLCVTNPTNKKIKI